MDASHAVIAARSGKGPALTSRQQFTVLDTLIANALEPVRCESGATFEQWVTEILAGTIKSRRGNASDMRCACVRILSGAPKPVQLLTDAGLDRGHVFRYLARVRKIHESMLFGEIALAEHGDDPRHRFVVHEARCLLGTSARLSPALTTAWYWLDLAVEWRDRIVDDYLRMLNKGASGASRRSGGRIEAEPAFHDSWITASHVVNRYRSDRSTLASVLNRALMGTYRVAASHAIGLAAPGARVSSAEAPQATALDDAAEIGSPALEPLAGEDAEALRLLRAVMAVAHHPDVRLALTVSDLSPTDAMRSVGLGPSRGPIVLG